MVDIGTKGRLTCYEHLTKLFGILERLVERGSAVSGMEPFLIDEAGNALPGVRTCLRAGPTCLSFPHSLEKELERLSIDLERGRYTRAEVLLLEEHARQLHVGGMRLLEGELPNLPGAGDGEPLELEELDALRAASRGRMH